MSKCLTQRCRTVVLPSPECPGDLHDHVQAIGQRSVTLVSETRGLSTTVSLFVWWVWTSSVVVVRVILVAQRISWCKPNNDVVKLPGRLRFEEMNVKVSKKKWRQGYFQLPCPQFPQSCQTRDRQTLGFCIHIQSHWSPPTCILPSRTQDQVASSWNLRYFGEHYKPIPVWSWCIASRWIIL